MLSGNLQCLKALLQRCGNRSLPQCCGNALRHCGLLQCAQRIAAMAPLRQYCGNEVLQQYCSNAAAIAVLQQHCGNAHCKVLLQYCGNRGHCGNAFWYCSNTPIFSRCKHFTCLYGLWCAPKIALFHSTGDLQRSNIALSRWRKGAQQCHSVGTNTMKATQQDCTKRTSNAVVPMACSVHPKYRFFVVRGNCSVQT